MNKKVQSTPFIYPQRIFFVLWSMHIITRAIKASSTGTRREIVHGIKHIDDDKLEPYTPLTQY
jgi:hypothetical protein